MFKIFKSLLSADERQTQRRLSRVSKINALGDQFSSLSDDALRGKTAEFKQQLADGTKLDDILVPAFATVREAAHRVLGQRHYDVQLIGGMILHEGSVAEMRTGEGKTLVSTLAAYLNALEGNGVHVVTVNDYLAGRDRALIGQVHEFLGLSVGLITQFMTPDDRRAAYGADITYCTNTQLGFDYLNDVTMTNRASMTQRPFHFAIVDEVDSVLIDEARMPLILSANTADNTLDYAAIDRLMSIFGQADYDIDERHRSIALTDAGLLKAETALRNFKFLNEGHLYDPANGALFHHILAALKAHKMMLRDRDYIVSAGEIVLIDASTGRAAVGRRLSDGIHQAIEAKERVEIKPETVTRASITYQNLFRSFPKISGMSGTAMTDAEEFSNVYGLDVIKVPTNRAVIRIDDNDEIYRSQKGKLTKIVQEVRLAQETLQPILIGTASIERSEEVARALEQAGFLRTNHEDPEYIDGKIADALQGRAHGQFSVLNARHNDKEADIIALAGMPGAITIATNMAGRGTDIQLGGNRDLLIARARERFESDGDKQNAEVGARIAHERLAAISSAAGGLFVIGTERAESRRIDNQLRGRSGRQGDPGRSRFYLSLEDDLLRIFGSTNKIVQMFDKLELTEEQAISSRLVSATIAKAQQRIEGQHFTTRKQVVEFDDVMNYQRIAIMRERSEILDSNDTRPIVETMLEQVLDVLMERHVPIRSYAEEWDIINLSIELRQILNIDATIADWLKDDNFDADALRQNLLEIATNSYKALATSNGETHDEKVEKPILLMALDQAWREHADNLEHLKDVVGWRAIAQRQPIDEFRNDAGEMFEKMLKQWSLLAVENLMTAILPAE